MQPQQPFYQQPGAFQTTPGPSGSKQKKLFIAIGVLLILAIILLIASVLSSDNTESLIRRSVVRHSEELRINELADSYKDDYELSKFKANLSVLVSSDASSLRSFLDPEAKPDKELVPLLTDTEAESRFDEAGSINNFKDEYRSTMTKQLEINLKEMKVLRAGVEKTELKTALDTAINNHEALLRQIMELN
ncbi:hypothetical protein KA529_03265 [Candidatus Saccharibacteria bacterium]|jgi:hypothetical protein|nr:hypothetical protein [Candidatus Saccharibacteria bacterium]